MPYSRSLRKSNYKSNQSKYKKGMSNIKQTFLINKLYKKVNRLSEQISGEVHKYSSYSTPGSSLTQTGYFDTFCGINQGDTNAQREGNLIKVKALRFAALINASTTSPEPFSRVRVFIAVDTQQIADALYPAASEIFDSTGQSIVVAPLNAASIARFNVLYDKVFTLTAANKPCITLTKYFKFKKGIKVRFNGTVATDVQKNNIFYVILTDNAVDSANNPVIQMVQMRTYFYDN